METGDGAGDGDFGGESVRGEAQSRGGDGGQGWGGQRNKGWRTCVVRARGLDELCGSDCVDCCASVVLDGVVVRVRVCVRRERVWDGGYGRHCFGGGEGKGCGGVGEGGGRDQREGAKGGSV